jgi:hypothetical protein
LAAIRGSCRDTLRIVLIIDNCPKNDLDSAPSWQDQGRMNRSSSRIVEKAAEELPAQPGTRHCRTHMKEIGE